MHYVGISTLSVHFILRQCTHTYARTHARIHLPFEDSEPKGLKVNPVSPAPRLSQNKNWNLDLDLDPVRRRTFRHIIMRPPSFAPGQRIIITTDQPAQTTVRCETARQTEELIFVFSERVSISTTSSPPHFSSVSCISLSTCKLLSLGSPSRCYSKRFLFCFSCFFSCLPPPPR